MESFIILSITTGIATAQYDCFMVGTIEMCFQDEQQLQEAVELLQSLPKNAKVIFTGGDSQFEKEDDIVIRTGKKNSKNISSEEMLNLVEAKAEELKRVSRKAQLEDTRQNREEVNRIKKEMHTLIHSEI